MEYEVVIGLETHVQLKTRTKMFCGCGTAFGATPNTHVCPVCLGYPGALPTLNGQAIRLTVMAGLMLGCDIAERSRFDRKNYFYPDSAKNYQITQNGAPLCLGGHVDLPGGRRIRLNHIHLEEDVGKLTHRPGCSGVDFNRGGLPLMEIVSEPDLRSPDEAIAYLTALREMMVYAGVSDCNLEEGNMRSDVNVSLRPKGQEAYGVKVEIKNMNTFSGIHFTMRTKENAEDYRYFPEPDLPPVILTQAQIDAWANDLPEAPAARRERMMRDYGIPEYDAGVLSADRALADFFEAAAKRSGNGKLTSNWVMAEVLALTAREGTHVKDSALTPEALGDLLRLLDAKTINGPTAKALLPELFARGGDPAAIVKERGLAQVADAGAIEPLVEAALADNPKVVADYRAGKQAALGFLVGQVMKRSKGKASPQLVQQLLRDKLA